ncbi:ADP-ribose pyrophosphatase [Chryseomicrobium aureum]|uniref:NUDIX hydrolase n=1 Tax=Chryseomicrobium aureum TaxID=1441723 RepID=UPI00195C34A4|nr:NUDIX hydrolase [Chryseomicrobium aureum]MBM7705473.1 ADP-ribose pyrophosphatase [Chryseomicrobium aureum]
MTNFEEKTTNTTPIYSGRVISLSVDDVVLPNGKPSKRELVKHPGAVAVIAITQDHKIVLVEQYRKALERTLVEIPAGKIEQGEDPKETAFRELEEETGYTASDLHFVQSFATSPGFADEIIHIYVAQGLKKVTENRQLDEDEFVEIHECSLAGAEKWIQDEKIYDAKTAFAIQWWRLHRF